MKLAADGRVILNLPVRNDPRVPKKVQPQMHEAPYTRGEHALMRAWFRQADEGDKEALNQVCALHELKALLGAELVEGPEEAEEEQPGLLEGAA